MIDSGAVAEIAGATAAEVVVLSLSWSAILTAPHFGSVAAKE